MQCLLCATVVRNDRAFSKHFMQNHSVYGKKRQCEVCGQFFTKRQRLLRHHRMLLCPGSPALYSQVNGKLYYRGRSADVMRSVDLYPRLRHNQIVATKNYDLYAQKVSPFRPTVEYSATDLPLNDLKSELYFHRDFAPQDPMLPSDSNVVISREKPILRSDLEKICAVGMVMGEVCDVSEEGKENIEVDVPKIRGKQSLHHGHGDVQFIDQEKIVTCASHVGPIVVACTVTGAGEAIESLPVAVTTKEDVDDRVKQGKYMVARALDVW